MTAPFDSYLEQFRRNLPMSRPLFVLLMGPQGAGKGEQAKFIRQQYGIPHVSTGDMFRAMKAREDDLARQVQAVMAAGQLISDDLTNQVVAERLAQPDCASGVILDGYPRTPNQAKFLDAYLEERHQALRAVILLEIDPFTAFKRAFGRVTASNGDSYNIYYRNEGLTIRHEKSPNEEYPPKIVATLPSGEVLKRRPDDADAHAVIVRIETYLRDTQPLIDYYAKRNGLLHRVDATQSIDMVSQAIKKLLDE
jgi:adenylate kinase